MNFVIFCYDARISRAASCIGAIVPFLVPPLHLLYTRYLVSDSGGFSGRDRLHFVPAVVVELLVFLVENTLMSAGINVSNFLITSICAGIYVYSIGYYGLLKSEVFSTPAVRSVMAEIIESASGKGISSRKYERSGLDEGTSESFASKLVHIMEREKSFTEASLTIAQLAGMLSISPQIVCCDLMFWKHYEGSIMKILLRLSIAIQIFFSASSWGSAQPKSGSIEGRGFDADTRSPLIGAHVVILGTSSGAANVLI